MREMLDPSGQFASTTRPGIVIVNRGAHPTKTSELLSAVRACLRFVRAAQPDALIIWRDTPPGHANCSSFSAPLSHRQDPSSLPFDWGTFYEQNAAVAQLIRVEFEGIIFADVTAATSLRADGHQSASDCLHYKARGPSPLDHWVRLFFNILSLLNKTSHLSFST